MHEYECYDELTCTIYIFTLDVQALKPQPGPMYSVIPENVTIIIIIEQEMII